MSLLLKVSFILAVVMLAAPAEAKKKKNPQANMQGSPFGQQKVQMVFITLRDEFANESSEHTQLMAKNFQQMMAAGGLHVGIVGTEKN